MAHHDGLVERDAQLAARRARLRQLPALIERYCGIQAGASVVDEFLAERHLAEACERAEDPAQKPASCA